MYMYMYMCSGTLNCYDKCDMLSRPLIIMQCHKQMHLWFSTINTHNIYCLNYYVLIH